MAGTMAPVMSAVSPSLAKEDSHGAWNLADERKLKFQSI